MVESTAMPVSIPAYQMPKPPVGVLGALRAGFAVVNNQLYLALFPLALDLFLWLGPKLSIKPLMLSLIQMLDQLAVYNPDPQAAQQLDQLRVMLTLVGDQYNLFSVLSTAPLGVPSLMAARMPGSIPPGMPQIIWPLKNTLFHLDLYILFSLAGLLLGAVYFNLIAQPMRPQRPGARQLLQYMGMDWVRLAVFAVLAALALVLVLLPVWLVGSLVAMLIPQVGVLLFVVSLTAVMWAIFYLGFTVPGIVLQRRGLLGALRDSVRVAHWNLSATTGLYSVVFLISLVLAFIWDLVKPDSWVTLAALGGNALVATALVAALFEFYRDRYRWTEEMRRVLQANLDRQKAAQNSRSVFS